MYVLVFGFGANHHSVQACPQSTQIVCLPLRLALLRVFSLYVAVNLLPALDVDLYSTSCIAGVIDSEYPDFCANTQSSVSALHVYRGAHLPERYYNRLFVGDYSKVYIQAPVVLR